MFHLEKVKEYTGDVASVWDTVKCATDLEMYHLVLNQRTSFLDMVTVIKRYGKLIEARGKLNTYTALLPFLGPLENLSEAGEGIGVFAKLYGSPSSSWKCQKEFDCVNYLGTRSNCLINMITINNFPKPRIIEGKLLLLPLILSTAELSKFCQFKMAFYKKYFNFPLALYHITSSRVFNGDAPNQIMKKFNSYLLTTYLWTQANKLDFYHADLENPDNMLPEDLCSLVHRLTGKWPRENHVVLNFNCPESRHIFCYSDSHLPIIIDYDYSYFTEFQYPRENNFDYLTERKHIMSIYNEHDLYKFFERTIYDNKSLIEKVAMFRVQSQVSDEYIRRHMYCKNYYLTDHRHRGCRIRFKITFNQFKTYPRAIEQIERRQQCRDFIDRINEEITHIINSFDHIIKNRANLTMQQCYHLSESFRGYLYERPAPSSSPFQYTLNFSAIDSVDHHNSNE